VELRSSFTHSSSLIHSPHAQHFLCIPRNDGYRQPAYHLSSPSNSFAFTPRDRTSAAVSHLQIRLGLPSLRRGITLRPHSFERFVALLQTTQHTNDKEFLFHHPTLQPSPFLFY
jgi:hypothetical protein